MSPHTPYLVPIPDMKATLYTALALACCLCAVDAAAQRLTVTLGGADTVRQGDALALTFAYENLAADGFALPELVGLVVTGGPSRQSRVSVVNGVRSSAEALTYRVVADQPGLALVPSVSVETADSTYASAPVTVFVTADPDYVAPEVAPPRAQPTPPTPPRRRRPTVKM